MSPNFKVQPPISSMTIPRPKPVTLNDLKCSNLFALDFGFKWQTSTLRSNKSFLHTSCFSKMQPPLIFLEIPRPKPVTFSVLKCTKWLALDLWFKWQKSTLRSNMPLLHTFCFSKVQLPLRFVAIPWPKPVTFSVPKCSK